MGDAVLRTHKVRLEPNNTQRSHFQQCAGTARFAWNWGLAEWQRQYDEFKNGKREKAPTAYGVRNDFNAIKRQEFPWVLGMSKCVPQEAFAWLGDAYKRTFKKQNRFPKFKKRGKCRDSFKITGDHARVEVYDIEQDDGRITQASYLRIAKAPGEIRMSEHLRWSGRIISVVVSRRADRWYAAFLIECEKPEPRWTMPDSLTRDRLGVDVGLREFVCSDGEVHSVPRHYRRAEALLRRRQRALSRKVRGSKNYARQQLRVAKTHARVADRRNDWLHKLSSRLVEENRVLVLEDLNIKGMTKNKRLAKSVLDTGFAEFRRQVEYKVRQAEDRSVVIADRWFPSSKLCSACGAKAKAMPLSVRTWTCDSCGAEHHRDLNAAINLQNYAGGSSASACGQFLTAGARGSSTSVKSPGRSRNPSSGLREQV